MKPLLILAGAFLIMSHPASAAIVTKEISYQDGATALTGTYVYDDSIQGKRPGVLVVPEWWGLTDYARGRAKQLAALGYAAFAVDMYGTDKTAATPDEAKALSKPFYDDRAVMRARAHAALETLLAQPEVDGTRVGAIGYCFGGTVALEMARAGEDLKGVVSFHGGLATTMPARPSTVKAQVLALNGGSDPFVSAEEKEGFVKEMTSSGVTFKSIDYPGATHAFTNPEATEKGKKFNMPIAYDPDADKKSFEEMKNFFARLFK